MAAGPCQIGGYLIIALLSRLTVYRHGELYLEFHRGTYTSHGSIKKGNRHSEILLRDVEVSLSFQMRSLYQWFEQHVATLASLSHKKQYTYPKEKIDDAWEKVLLNQFHDGTSPRLPRCIC